MAGNSMALPGVAADLGMGGALGQQVASETDEERKKRLAMMQQQQMLGPAGSLAVGSIFGGMGSKSAGY
jgi:hypothetical protein